MRHKVISLALLSAYLLVIACEARIKLVCSASKMDAEPVYTRIAEYYDNRKAAVTITFDDYAGYGEPYEAAVAMLTAKRLYFTAGVITRATNINWTNIQRALDKGYMEAGSHSRTHQHLPYSDYDSEVGGSKSDIIGNLTLPPLYSFNGSEHVYSWIEPFGLSDGTVRKKLGYYRYLTDRNVAGGITKWATWDSVNGLFNRVGFSVEMGEPPSWSGMHDNAALNAKFDSAYSAGGIYHLTSHPNWVNWAADGYADAHTDHIKDRPDVWYVSLGHLYLYRWVATQNVVQVSWQGSGKDKVFKINMSSTSSQDYGVRYPITYVFNVSSSWMSGHVYYRFKETGPWSLMANKSSGDFFNGINAFRFDFMNHKAYVSVGFSEVSNNIYIQLRADPPLDTAPPVAEAGSDQTVLVGENATFDASVSSDDWGIVSCEWDFGDGTTGTGLTTTHAYAHSGIYTVTLTVKDVVGNTDTDSLIVTVLAPTEVSSLFQIVTMLVLFLSLVYVWRLCKKLSMLREKQKIHKE